MHNRTSPNKDSMLVIIALFVINACFAGTIPATPENITVTFLTPTTVRISWQTMIDLNAHPIEKYIVTYKSTDDSYRVVQDVAGNSGAVILDRLSPSTQYSIAVTAIWLGKKYRSRQIIFKTLDSAKISSQLEFSNGMRIPVNKMEKTINDSTYSDDVTSTATNTLSNGTHRELPTIRGVEIGIVLIVLMVWAGAIALFFNRWGKIRMLLPYQPDYKHEQLKVPGTGMCAGGVCNGQHSHQFESSECGALACQSLHYNSKNFRKLQDDHSTSVSERCSRSRINSAVFASSEDRGFDSIEFLRRHGSQSVLCRKAKSAENLRQNEAKQNSISNKMEWCGDECSKAIKERNSKNSTEIKLRRMSSAKQNEDLLNSKEEHEVTARRFATNHSAAVTTFNVVIGSISIETPPTHLKGEHYLSDSSAGAQMVDHRRVKTLKPDSVCRGDLTDNDEEFIVVSRESKPHEPVHQCSPSLTISSPSPSIHSHTGPQTVNQGRGNKKVPAAAPRVCVSAPPSADGEDLVTECL